MAFSYVAVVTVTAFVCALVLVPIASALAKRVGLVDKPNGRKRHVGDVPLAGGIAVLVGLWLALPFLPKSTATWAIVLLSAPLFILGAVDDRFDLSARLRILAQLGIGMLLVFAFGVTIGQLDSVSSAAPLVLGPVAAILFTLMCTCGVLNAINMADGIDGLLGSVASISLAAIAFLCMESNAIPEATISLLVMGLLGGYLSFNLGLFGPGRRVFLGDSGSMLVGLVLLVLLVELSQKDTPVITPTSAGWLLGLPLLDTVTVMMRRIIQGRSPFAAGRDHFHHVLQDLGLSRKLTLNVLVALLVLFVIVGVFANKTQIPQHDFFWAFVVVTLVQFFGVNGAVRFVAKGVITEQGIASKGLRKVSS